jgi:hypothetical protein
MKPIKLFNFTMPYDLYCELQIASRQAELPIAVLVRRGIRHVLDNKVTASSIKEDELVKKNNRSFS